MFSARYFLSGKLFSAVCFTILMLAFVTTPAAHSQNGASIQSFTLRPFVTGITPVIGPNGAVGGVAVDTNGIVSRVEPAEEAKLRGQWLQAQLQINQDVVVDTNLRVISLARLDRAITQLNAAGKLPSQEMFFLAGLRKIEYVFAVPEQNDVLVAGPAGAWKANSAGEVVSVKDGQPILRLDDLISALRSASAADAGGITCSIEPTQQGLKNYARVRARMRSFSKQAVRAMEQAMGAQQVIVTGVETDSHFARVMVAADYVMKRLAMGFDQSPIDDMPSYMNLLRTKSNAGPITSPRWWMTADYLPMQCTPDRLAWRIRSRGIKTLTEDSLLDQEGQRTTQVKANPVAQQWADTMTDNYQRLSAELPIFGELQNCIDLAVAGALIASEGLLAQADCKLTLLDDPDRFQLPRYPTPATIPSQASLVKARRGWLISVSGGVEIDAWTVVSKVEEDAGLTPLYQKSQQGHAERWWW